MPSQALRVVGHRHAGEHPVEAEPPGVLEVADAEGLAVLGVEAPADAGLADPVGEVSRSSSTKPNRRRTGGAWARSSTSLAVARLPATSSSWAATPSSGLVRDSARSASWTRSRCAGWPPSTTSPRPNAAVMSGA